MRKYSKPTFSLIDIIRWILGFRRRVLVEGESMSPSLLPNESLFVKDDYYNNHLPQIGDIVLLKHPKEPQRVIVKRIHKIQDGNIFVTGDNPPKSTDSRHFGSIRRQNIIAKVTSKL